MRYRFYTADVFTDRPFGGNPLAVLPDASALSEAQMRLIAREFNLSETTFVLPPEDPRHTRRLRIFTPARELPFAGHPTVGAALVLAAAGELGTPEPGGEELRIVLEEGVGPVPVSIRWRDGKPAFAQLAAAQLPASGPPPPGPAALAEMLSLAPEDLEDDAENVSCGVPFAFLPVRGRAALARARVRPDRFEALFPGAGAPELYLFCREPELPGSHLRARMFAPALGIAEDPATGGAVAALGGYLGWRDERQDGTLAWTVEQGFEMGRPSLLQLEVDKRGGEIAAVRVGGAAVLVSEGTIEAPG